MGITREYHGGLTINYRDLLGFNRASGIIRIYHQDYPLDPARYQIGVGK